MKEPRAGPHPSPIRDATRPWRNYLTIFARMSDSRRILISSPSTLISVPEYLPKSTSSPSITPIGARSPESSSLPGPTARTLPALRLFLGGVGKHDAAGRLLLGLDLLDHDAVFQGTNLLLGHGVVSFILLESLGG